MRIVSYWMVFLLTWGFLGRIIFEPTGLFGARWWFHFVGHAIAGALIVVTCLDPFFGRAARFWRREATVTSVFISLLAWAILWEGLEALGRASTGLLNTSFFTSVGGTIDTGSDVGVALVTGGITWWWKVKPKRQLQPAERRSRRDGMTPYEVHGGSILPLKKREEEEVGNSLPFLLSAAIVFIGGAFIGIFAAVGSFAASHITSAGTPGRLLVRVAASIVFFAGAGAVPLAIALTPAMGKRLIPDGGAGEDETSLFLIIWKLAFLCFLAAGGIFLGMMAIVLSLMR